MTIHIPDSHPRAASLRTREQIIEACREQVVAFAGLIAHGRGEAFDYLLGEKTPGIALDAVRAAAAALLLAEHPVLSVNGNVAALCPESIVRLGEVTGAGLEINLFYRTPEREQAIKQVLQQAGAREILGLDARHREQIPELQSQRRVVDSRGIYRADVVLVPLEDGDRTEALVKMGKEVITIDLNPLSRTAGKADITIVDEVQRAMQLLVQAAGELQQQNRKLWVKIRRGFDNRRNLAASIEFIRNRLNKLAAGLA